MKKLRIIGVVIVFSLLFGSCATPLCATYGHSTTKVPQQSKPMNVYQTKTFNGGF